MKKSVYYILVFSLVMLGACRSAKRTAPRFYVLEIPHDKNLTDTLPPLPFAVELQSVEVHPAFASNQIAVREDSHELKYFVNYQWAGRPAQMIERYVQNYFERTGVFKEIHTRYWNELPDLALQVHVYQLEVIYQQKNYYANLNVEFRLVNPQDRSLVLSHSSDRTRLLEKRNVNLFADAISLMLFEQLHFFAQKAYFQFTEEEPEPETPAEE